MVVEEAHEESFEIAIARATVAVVVHHRRDEVLEAIVHAGLDRRDDDAIPGIIERFRLSVVVVDQENVPLKLAP